MQPHEANAFFLGLTSDRRPTLGRRGPHAVVCVPGRLRRLCKARHVSLGRTRRGDTRGRRTGVVRSGRGRGPPGQESQHGSQRGAPASSAPGRCARHARVHCSRRRHRGPRDPSGNPAVAPRACERCPDTRGPRTRRTSARRAPRRPRTRGTSARRGSAPGRALRSAPGVSLWRRSRCGPCSLSNARL